MPGAGKSFWGKRWADKYEWQFVDLDVMIERHIGTSIATFFSQNRESAFRAIEQTMLQTVTNDISTKTIIATGGGTPIFHNNLQFMKQNGCVVYLKAAISQLVEHLAIEPEKRPLLQNTTDPIVKIADLLQKRAVFYQQADFTYAIETLTDSTFAQITESCTNRRL